MTITQYIYAWLLRGLSFIALRNYWRCTNDDAPLVLALHSENT